MSDRSTMETLEPKVGLVGTDIFGQAVRQVGHDIRKQIKESESISLNEILGKVLDWEDEFLGKVDQGEIEALQTLSLMLGMVKFDIERRNENRLAVRLENIKIEHDVLRTVFNNLDETGKPSDIIAKSFTLVTDVFDDLLYTNHYKVSDKGAATRYGIWTGSMGMTTAALMFHNEGWQVALPDPEFDLKYEADLIVKAPNGKIFTVDVTARTPASDKTLTNESTLFFVRHEEARTELKEQIENLSGTIRINIPSLLSRESDEFYADRKSGYPNDRSMSKFRGMLDK